MHMCVCMCVCMLECVCVCVCPCTPLTGESNSQILALTDELSKKNDDLVHHQEDMTQLLSQMVDLQHRVKEVKEL